MKTLLLILFLQVSQLFPINLNSFISQSATNFEKYCTENSVKFDKGELNNKNYIRAYFDDLIVVGIYLNEIEAFKIYYPKESYSIDKLEKMITEKLFAVEGKDKIYIDMENPKILYKLSDSEDERFNSIFIYIHGMQ